MTANRISPHEKRVKIICGIKYVSTHKSLPYRSAELSKPNITYV
jgi:hypothetical protein